MVILTGGDDQIVDVGRQSRRLHKKICRSEFIALPGLGHMVHYLAPDQVIKAIDRATPIWPTRSLPLSLSRSFVLLLRSGQRPPEDDKPATSP